MAQIPTPPAPSPIASHPFEGVFSIGGIGNDTDRNLNKVGEYVPLENTARLGGETWGETQTASATTCWGSTTATRTRTTSSTSTSSAWSRPT